MLGRIGLDFGVTAESVPSFGFQAKATEVALMDNSDLAPGG